MRFADSGYRLMNPSREGIISLACGPSVAGAQGR